MAAQITPSKQGVWVLRDIVTPAAIILNNGKQYIPSFLINAEFNSPYVAVGIKVTAAGENWRFGGHLAQEFSFPGSGYRNSGKAFFRTEELIINNVSIIEIPVITGQPYKLRFFPPTWFRDLRLEIWEYSAEAAKDSITESLEILALLAKILLDLGIVQDGSLATLLSILISLDIPDILEKIDFIYKFITALTPSNGLSGESDEGKFFGAN